MTDAEKIAALVEYRLEQANEALAAAALNLTNALQRSAINRAYYAMFYAVLALLASRTIETSRHTGAIAQFDLLYVKPEVFRADLSRWLHKAFLHRQAADYGAEQTLTRPEIEALIAQAREFVGEVRGYFTRPAKPQ
ncbi:MAG: HEPN domain-containing protein [Vicinamibacterales bacterium]